jgi:4-diphosphocytidyl-2-C-methyl-D-erythritol kinase
MRGIGDVLDPVPAIPPLWAVLVNPGIGVPTGPVFRALASVDNAPLPNPAWSDAEGLLQWLATTRNDLEPVACALVPAVDDVLSALRGTKDCRLARMSGSGGTCFGLFTTPEAADDAAARLRERSPDWWIEMAGILTDPPA